MREEELNKEIELEYTRLGDMEKLQQELTNLNTSLNACIDIVSTSIARKGLSERFDHMKSDNQSEYLKAYQEMDNQIDESRGNINRLNNVKKDLLEEEKES